MLQTRHSLVAAATRRRKACSIDEASKASTRPRAVRGTRYVRDLRDFGLMPHLLHDTWGIRVALHRASSRQLPAPRRWAAFCSGPARPVASGARRNPSVVRSCSENPRSPRDGSCIQRRTRLVLLGWASIPCGSPVRRLRGSQTGDQGTALDQWWRSRPGAVGPNDATLVLRRAMADRPHQASTPPASGAYTTSSESPGRGGDLGPRDVHLPPNACVGTWNPSRRRRQ